MGVDMQVSDCEERKINIWEQMRAIEGELFLLSARSGELDFADRHRFQCLCVDRTHLASELLLRAELQVSPAPISHNNSDSPNVVLFRRGVSTTPTKISPKRIESGAPSES